MLFPHVLDELPLLLDVAAELISYDLHQHVERIGLVPVVHAVLDDTPPILGVVQYLLDILAPELAYAALMRPFEHQVRRGEDRARYAPSRVPEGPYHVVEGLHVLVGALGCPVVGKPLVEELVRFPGIEPLKLHLAELAGQVGGLEHHVVVVLVHGYENVHPVLAYELLHALKGRLELLPLGYLVGKIPKEIDLLAPGQLLERILPIRPVVPGHEEALPLVLGILLAKHGLEVPGDGKGPAPVNVRYVAVLWRIVLDVSLEVVQCGGFPHPRPAEEDVVLGGIKSKAVYEDVLQLANGARFNGQFVLEVLFLRYDDTRERVPGEVIKGHELPMQLKYLNFAT